VIPYGRWRFVALLWVFFIKSSTPPSHLPSLLVSRLLGTRWTTARQSLTLFFDNVCVRPAVTNFPCNVIVATLTAVGCFLLLDRLPGTYCPKTFGIRKWLKLMFCRQWLDTYMGQSLKTFFFTVGY